MKGMKKSLFVTPFFGRSGSEIALLNLVNSLNDNFRIKIMTQNINPILKEKLTKGIEIVYPLNKSWQKNIFYRGLKKIRYPRSISAFDELITENDFDFILLNTLISIRDFDTARKKCKKTILYVHETEQMLTYFNNSKLKSVVDNVDLILCSSEYVKEYLKVYGRKNNIEVLYPPLAFSNLTLPLKRNDIRESLGFSTSNFIWAMSGDILINKNPRMFIEAAIKLYHIDSNSRFVWYGASGSSAYEMYLTKYVKAIGLEKIIKFIDKRKDDYFSYLNEINGFVLTSLSESFSLVSLEAAIFGKPVVSFPCGGVIEAVPKSLLSVTNEFSIKELVQLMSDVMNNEFNQSLTCNEIQKMFSLDITIIRKRFLEILYCYNILE
jgi:glycosyltransferase involved in cell wall biosynthesis